MKFFRFSGLQGRIGLGVFLIAVIQAIAALWLVSYNSGIRASSDDVRLTYQPLTETLEQLHHDVGSFASGLRTDILRRDTANAPYRNVVREKSLIPGIAQLRLNRSVFSPDVRLQLDSLNGTLMAVERLAQDVDQWFAGYTPAVIIDSASQAQAAAELAAFFDPRLQQLDRLERQYDRHHDVLREDLSLQLAASFAEINARAKWSRLILFTALAVTLAILLIGGFRVIRRMRRSLSGAIGVLNRLVEGDTAESAVAADDEMRPIIEAANRLSDNLQKASEFARAIGDGNVDHDFKAVGESDVLGNSLLQMRQKLKSINEEDAKRNWSTAGLARFADILRRNDDYRSLAGLIVSELVKYTRSNQGGLFVVNEDNANAEQRQLELIACYAFERKKFLQKTLDTGNGLVGQCYLEKRTIFMRKVPQNYVNITSGLGGANPSSLLLVPLKVNDDVEGVLEMASFKEYAEHEIAFVEQVAEIIASTISNARVNDKTRKLLQESQQHAEELRAQEEEMRQNMEEMQATQEQMHRQAEEMRKMQENLTLEKSMFNVLMEYLPDRITYKDRESRILRINKAKAERFRMSPEEMIGKTDYDFFSKEHADKAFREEQELIRTGQPLLNVEERAVFANGDVTWASTSRIPFRNDRNEAVGMFIITKDITQLKRAELTIRDRERVIERLLDGMPVFRFTVSRERLVTNVWKAAALPELPHLESRPLIDALPEVHDLISQEDLDHTDLICKGVLEINGEKEVFKYYLFPESALDGVFLGFGLKQ
ncbi:MAG: PAS domain-containing protein [Cyclobacteriaceae bacterium]|nr:PAS domain-containing protein [Cyclobacteriaceae bacterium]